VQGHLQDIVAQNKRAAAAAAAKAENAEPKKPLLPAKAGPCAVKTREGGQKRSFGVLSDSVRNARRGAPAT